MLDNFNLYRKTGEARYLENARRYAAILKIDPAAFPRRYARAVSLTVPRLDTPPGPR